MAALRAITGFPEAFANDIDTALNESEVLEGKYALQERLNTLRSELQESRSDPHLAASSP